MKWFADQFGKSNVEVENVRASSARVELRLQQADSDGRGPDVRERHNNECDVHTHVAFAARHGISGS
jgi:hypothetical protein